MERNQFSVNQIQNLSLDKNNIDYHAPLTCSEKKRSSKYKTKKLKETKDDVYERDIVAEVWEQERRWSCCMPYDCMCYEDIPLPQIWKKVNQERKVG